MLERVMRDIKDEEKSYNYFNLWDYDRSNNASKLGD